MVFWSQTRGEPCLQWHSASFPMPLSPTPRNTTPNYSLPFWPPSHMNDNSSQYPCTETLCSLSHRKLLILYAWFIASERDLLKTMSTLGRILNRLRSWPMDYWPYIVGFLTQLCGGLTKIFCLELQEREDTISMESTMENHWPKYLLFSSTGSIHIEPETWNYFAFHKADIVSICRKQTCWLMDGFWVPPLMLLQWVSSYFLYSPLGTATMNSFSTDLRVQEARAEPSDWHGPKGSSPQTPWNATAINNETE